MKKEKRGDTWVGYRPSIMKDKTKYTRKEKHKKNWKNY
jgi:hypothetical protein